MTSTLMDSPVFQSPWTLVENFFFSRKNFIRYKSQRNYFDFADKLTKKSRKEICPTFCSDLPFQRELHQIFYFFLYLSRTLGLISSFTNRMTHRNWCILESNEPNFLSLRFLLRQQENKSLAPVRNETCPTCNTTTANKRLEKCINRSSNRCNRHFRSEIASAVRLEMEKAIN